jgi:hypothetical protein
MDCIHIGKNKFDKKAIGEDLVRDTWFGILEDAESLPDKWTRTTGVLMGRRLFEVGRRRNG